MSYESAERRHALNLTTAGIGMIMSARGPVQNATALVEAAAIVERFLLTGQVEPEPFKIGDLTKARVFEAAGLQNLSNLQAFLDAVEAALVVATTNDEPVGPYTMTAQTLATAVVLVDVAGERERQQDKGWTEASDDTRRGQELAACAGFAILPKELRRDIAAPCWIEPDSRRDELVKGIAMAVAEVERLDRANIAHAVSEGARMDLEAANRTHGASSAIDDELPMAERKVKAEDGPARNLTTSDMPDIVREAVLTVAAQLQHQGQRQVHGRDALG